MLPVKMYNNNTAACILAHEVGKKSWFALQISTLFRGEYFYLTVAAYCFLVQMELHEKDDSLVDLISKNVAKTR